jgi:hypothetical protein
VTRLRSLIALVVSASALLAISLATGGNAGGQAPFRSDLSNFTPETVKAFTAFPIYSLGTQFEDLPLRAIVRVDRDPLVKARAGYGVPGNRTNHLNFIYGTCGGGCTPPLTVQIWPACDRTLQDYYYNVPDGGPSRPYERVTIRGVPAAKFSGMLEIYSGTVTIVIFGQTSTQQERAAESLVSANTLAGTFPPANRFRLPLPARWRANFTASSRGCPSVGCSPTNIVRRGASVR